jgi:hypothetical protein
VDVGVFRVNPRVIVDTLITTTATSTDTVIRRADAGDLRVQAKVDTSAGNATRTLQGVSSKYLVKYPAAPTDRLGLLKNGELVLDRALILWGLNRDPEALVLVNGVRSAAGLGVAAPADHQALLREILKQVRYEVLFESPSRFILYRSLGILNELGKERALNPVARFPIPSAENVARSGNVTCAQ